VWCTRAVRRSTKYKYDLSLSLYIYIYTHSLCRTNGLTLILCLCVRPLSLLRVDPKPDPASGGASDARARCGALNKIMYLSLSPYIYIPSVVYTHMYITYMITIYTYMHVYITDISSCIRWRE